MASPHLAILGAGPIGLEAALAAAQAGLSFTLYEAADEVAGHMGEWGHVRLFTAWDLNVSPRARQALAAAGHDVPTGEACPTGEELRRRVLAPLAALPSIAPHLRLGTRMLAVGRAGLLKNEEIASSARAGRPFRLLVEQGGRERIAFADRVIDTTGSYSSPNWLGDGGIPAPGETGLDGEIARRIPDLAREASSYAGKTTLLIGAGHSAQTAARDLAALAATAPGTRVVWALRSLHPAWANISDDPLPERAALAKRSGELCSGMEPAVMPLRGVVVESLARENGRITVTLRGEVVGEQRVEVDHVLALTGAVGDHGLYRQLQIHECYATGAPMKLSGALLGAGGGDCLAQTSHGPDTLKNPEPGFFILGAKSYGRNTTFLMRTGWEQVAEVFSLLG